MAMVCSCHVVSERRIARTIDRGACSVADVAAACGAGATCHGCHDAIEAMVRSRRPAEVARRPTGVTVRVA
jgi:bacterioferritin-associated ferredoxin